MPEMADIERAQQSEPSGVARWPVFLNASRKGRLGVLLVGGAVFFTILQFGMENLGVKLQFPIAATVTVFGLFGLIYSLLTPLLAGRERVKIVLSLLAVVTIAFSVRDQLAARYREWRHPVAAPVSTAAMELPCVRPLTFTLQPIQAYKSSEPYGTLIQISVAKGTRERIRVFATGIITSITFTNVHSDGRSPIDVGGGTLGGKVADIELVPDQREIKLLSIEPIRVNCIDRLNYGHELPNNVAPLLAPPTATPERIFTNRTVRELLSLYEGHTSIQGDELMKPFIGMWIKVTGIVSEINPLPGGYLAVLSVKGDAVGAKFDEKWAKELKRTFRGDTIKLQGKIRIREPIALYIEDCELY
jgi:hypothetical protein